MSWKPEVIADNSGKWAGNALRFATRAEAQENVRDLAMRWLAVRETRVVKSTDPVNYAWAGQLVGVVYKSSPAAKLNPEGDLMGAWVVKRYVVIDRPGVSSFGPVHVPDRIVARFNADGRDAAERWAQKRGIKLFEGTPEYAVCSICRSRHGLEVQHACE